MNIEILKGKTLTSIDVSEDQCEVFFTCSNGGKYKMYHIQDCCESVSLAEVIGDLNDLLDTPIITAEERVSHPDDNKCWDSITWTFYELATIKGYVTLRWIGESNGYYSESVDFHDMSDLPDYL